MGFARAIGDPAGQSRQNTSAVASVPRVRAHIYIDALRAQAHDYFAGLGRPLGRDVKARTMVVVDVVNRRDAYK